MIRRTPLKRSQKPIARRRKKPRRGPMRDLGYLAFLREEGQCWPCWKNGLLSVIKSRNRCDPMHGPINGMRSKGPDSEAIPGCRRHHEEQTSIGWPAFESKYGFDRAKEAATWYAAYQIWREHTRANPD